MNSELNTNVEMNTPQWRWMRPMTDAELIDWVEARMGVGIQPGEGALTKRLVTLARAGLAKQPPEGAVKVQLAVVYGVGGEVISFPCGDWEAPEEALNAAWRCVDMPTHVAIVTAWLPPLPPVQTLEVEGTCSQSS
mgnify:CR=1 FL=1